MKKEIWVNNFIYFLVKNLNRNRINSKLYKRLFEIESKGYKTVFGKIFENYENKGNSQNITYIKNSIKQIAQENLYMYKRLRDKQPTYDMDKLLKDYTKNQYYKQNACRYPSIDFYKEKKLISTHDKKRINKKNKIKIICKTENNYIPKISKTIISSFHKDYTKNTNNTFEGFGYLKLNKIKGKKKKFKDFNFKDLKSLKIYKIKNNLENNSIKKTNKINNEKEDENDHNEDGYHGHETSNNNNIDENKNQNDNINENKERESQANDNSKTNENKSKNNSESKNTSTSKNDENESEDGEESDSDSKNSSKK